MGSPNKFSDPYWSRLADQVEAKLELPAGLLNRIVNLGERSNADQVSEKGAKSPFQIIPATRAAAIKKYGIDPYLSDENAAEVAGNLLKDSLDRNGGNEAEAVGEYHGGVDRSNWGPRTRAYIGRVTGGGRPSAEQPQTESAAPMSTYDRIKAKQDAAVPVSQIANVYAAYQAGTMDPADAKQFEGDVKAGRVLLPEGHTLGKAAPTAPAAGGGNAEVLPAPVAKAYADGTMGEDDRIQLEQDVRAGVVALPAGVTLGNTQRPGIVDKVKESITGDKRRTAATEAAPDWADMPELNSFSMAGAKTGLGTMISNPSESVQVIQSNFPGVKVRQDEKGNYFLRSSIDGKEYAIKPGFRPSDIPRAGAAVAAFTPAGRATSILGAGAATGATQAAIEATQSATGGTFNAETIPEAAVFGAAVPAVVRAVKAGIDPAKEVIRNARGLPPPGTPPGTVPPVATMSADELASTTRAAAAGGLGSKGATAKVAEQTLADPKILAAAKRLGIEDHLQPDHVTTNQAYRELAQAVKSVPGSETRAAELAGLEAVAKRADDLVEELGGARDLSTVDATIKNRMAATQKELTDKADQAYSDLRANIPARAEAPAPTVLQFIKKRAEDLDGLKNLTSMERNIVRKLAPKDILDDAGEVIGQKQPTYALLDDVRRDLTAARVKKQGPFKDADTGMIKKLERELLTDQKAAANAHGQLPQFEAAQGLVRVRKGLEDDMVALFGKELNKSMVGDLNQSLAALPKGDTSKLLALLKALPENMRQDTVASGLSSAFNVSAKNQQLSFKNYAQWYEGLVKNKQSYTMLMANLPPEARKRMSDLYRVSKGISDATRERITTGRIMAVSEQLRGADTLMGNLFDLAKRSSVGAVAEVGTTAAGMPGTGLAAGIASALTKGKPNAMKAADALISSPEFLAAARAGTPAAARRLALSKAFADYRRALKNPRELSNPEKWIQRALLANNLHTDKQPPKKKD
ncbi:MAG: hypothetical protein V4641_21625 [Pseudomonadota bacterium]